MGYRSLSVSLDSRMNNEYKNLAVDFFKPFNEMKELFEVANRAQGKPRQSGKPTLDSEDRLKGNIAVQGDYNV